MKILKLMTIVIVMGLFFGCGTDSSTDSITPVIPRVKSSGSSLLQLELSYNQSVYSFKLKGDSLMADRAFPFGIKSTSIKSLKLSDGAKSSKLLGASLSIGLDSIIVTSENDSTSHKYFVSSTNLAYSSIVVKNGRLSVSGNKIVNKNGEPISLAGNSFYWTNDNWGGERFYNSSVVSWLKLDWNTSIVRAAMGVEDPGGYLQNKSANMIRLKYVVDAAINSGLYVIIDWHSHYAHLYEAEAVAFFSEMATTYGNKENVIYEIYNEPKYINADPINDKKFVTWNETIKPYAEKVIAAIRAKDPDNLIVVGTGEWSQKVDDAAANPITDFTNIAYTLHFYSKDHKQWLRDRASAALAKGIALFVTEWGAVGGTQTDPESDLWMKWCVNNKISNCCWAINDKDEPWSSVVTGGNPSGNWTDSYLTETGKYNRNIIRNWSN